MKKTGCMTLAAIVCVLLFSACANWGVQTQKTAKELVVALKEKGFPMETIIEYDEASDTSGLLGKPNQYTSKARFSDNRLEQTMGKENPFGGTIEVFSNGKDAKARFEFLEGSTGPNSILRQYYYLKGNVVLRIDRGLAEEEGEKYSVALNEILKGK